MTDRRRRDPASTDPLDGVRPGGRRSFWLREALAGEAPGLATDLAAPPFAGSGRADVAILGGGYTGLWTAIRIREADPSARVVVLERDVSGGGPSGRNGGFVTGWWDELAGLVHRFGEAEAVRAARALDTEILGLGPWLDDHDIDADWQLSGFLSVSAAPSQDGGWLDSAEACARAREAERWRPLDAAEVAGHARSPAFRGGAWMPTAGIIQPAKLARGLRRVALEAGVEIHERTLATYPPDRTAPGPVLIATTSSEGSGTLEAEHVVVATNAWAAAWRPVARRMLTWSSYLVITEPVPEKLVEIGWTGGEGIADGRFTLHYGRTTPDGRIALGGGGGRAGWGGRIGRAFTHDATSARRAAEGLRRWFPTLADARIEDAWGGPIDITDDHRPWFGTRPGGRIHFVLGYSGNGVAPAMLGGRILASLALGRQDDFTSLPIVGDRATPRAFPPEPFRALGARVFREAMVIRERAEEAGREAPAHVRAVTRIPRRLGYRLGPE